MHSDLLEDQAEARLIQLRPTLSIQSRLKRVKLVRMTPERVPAPENESNVALALPVPQQGSVLVVERTKRWHRRLHS